MDLAVAREALVGAWQLVAYADRDSVEAPWIETFGADPQGLIVYHHSGRMSVHVAAALGDEAAPWQYVGYFGLFEIESARQHDGRIQGLVLHHMEAAYPRELLDEGPARDFTLEGDELMLGDGLTARRTLRRVE